MVLDYETLKLIWWLLIGVLLIGFAITDGFDMGVAMLLKIVGKTDTERRIMINSIAPHWDGNQVWFITAGGAIFAAWPMVYATAFSGFYFAMMLTLMALFLRPVGFDYRSKLENSRWRNAWDWGLSAGSLVPALVFGVAFGNLLQGVPFHFDEVLRVSYQGGFFGLLNPFGLLCGVLSIAMLAMQGVCWLQLKTQDGLLRRAAHAGSLLGFGVSTLFVLCGAYLLAFVQGYEVVSMGAGGDVLTPIMKTVTRTNPAWLNNFTAEPALWLIPGLGVLLPTFAAFMSGKGRGALAFAASSLALAAIILTAAVALFPFVMPSSLEPNHSLTLFDAVSSEMTLRLMFWVAVIFVPIVLSYTLWSYWKMFGRLNDDYIHANDHSLY